ncbi:MAG: N-6 DNA methylase [Draconibacterium sp.]|nr:N-6 DNA methylase [Draconibacterium sp.]
MNIAQIEINLQKLIATFNKQSFIYELLLAYGLPKASITRLKKGNLNLSKVEGEISWKKKLFFREEQKEDLHLTISEITKELKRNERFVIVTDYLTLLAVDTKTDDKLDIELKDLPKYYDFFLPWAGMEKAQHANENPADVKAAEKMAKLFDEIKKDNPDDSPEFIHGLNVFLSRLLFCFFAEDTHIFEDNQFTNDIDSHTQTNGSDLNTYLDTLFAVLNTPEKERKNLPEYLKAFPFVNGGLFEKEYKTPKFSRSSRSAILNSGDQDWSAINPDIFGSMFQAVIGAKQRGSLGQHYTSVPNIMKVIEPLFLNELYEELENTTAKQNSVKTGHALSQLLNRIYNIKIFDPACGSGNFLIIAYKELRILEMKIFKAGNMMALSGIQLSQFYGIEIDDFAGEIAKLALWLAEHQMNVEFFKEFGRTNPTLPLKEAGKIVQGNATRLDWEVVCPKNEDDEIYILGNPPYLGYSRQSVEQKQDMEIVFSFVNDYKKLDYITCWFYKGAKYIKGINSKLAFVTTNSICQGIQVSLLWPTLFNEQIEIAFSHLSFKWENNAKSNAGVYVIIIGLRNTSSNQKFIFYDNRKLLANNINPYLSNSKNIIVTNRSKSLSNIPQMLSGLKAGDDGNLILSEIEKDDIISKFPNSKRYIRKYIGAKDFMNNVKRFCIWVKDDEYENANSISGFEKRFVNLRKFRLASKKVATQRKAKKPYAFDETNLVRSNSIMVPQTGSERREYIPIGFLNLDYVISNAARVIYDAKPWLFGLLSSKMHITWVKAVAGRLKMDMQYSNTLCYNTFPFPPISTQRKNEITQATFRILEEREKHSDKTLAQLYDPDKMPDGLREAHRQNDEIIEKCYRSTPFKSDEERLEYLFKLYEKMIAEEKEQGTLFAKENLPAGKAGKTRKKRK